MFRNFKIKKTTGIFNLNNLQQNRFSFLLYLRIIYYGLLYLTNDY